MCILCVRIGLFGKSVPIFKVNSSQKLERIFRATQYMHVMLHFLENSPEL